MPEPEPVVGALVTETAALAIQRALENRVNWYEARRYDAPDDVLEALDTINPVVTQFAVARAEAEASRIRREAQDLVDTLQERKGHERDVEARKP